MRGRDMRPGVGEGARPGAGGAGPGGAWAAEVQPPGGGACRRARFQGWGLWVSPAPPGPALPSLCRIYWGCFYFFPWLRMWRRERR